MSAAAQTAPIRRYQRVLSAIRIESKDLLAEAQRCYSACGAVSGNQYSPAFFIASVTRRTWNPAIVAIWDGNHEPAGILYAKERRVLGLKTGLFFADATLGALIAGNDDDQEQAFRAGMTALLKNPGMRGLRLLAPPAGHEVESLQELARDYKYEFRVTAAESHLILPLTANYEDFLAQLGSRTRRNFRYYRRGSHNAGHAYVEDLTMAEFSAGAWKLEAQAPTGGSATGLERALRMFGAARRPLLVGLRSAEGELLSLVGGWYEDGRAVIFMQLNSDKRHAKYSLSLVTRTHLIESLIQKRYREIVWWAGVGEPISHYCRAVPSAWVYLDRPSGGWRALRSLLDRNRKRVPARFREVSEWVVPPSLPAAHPLTVAQLATESD